MVNVAQRDVVLALGGSLADVEALWRQYTEASKTAEGAAAFEANWQTSLDAVQAAMETTGLTMLELRNKVAIAAEKLGLSLTDAFDVVVAQGLDASKKVTDAWLETSDTVATNFEQMQRVIEVALIESGGVVTDEIKDMQMQLEIAFQAAEADAAALADSLETQFHDLSFTVGIGFDVDKLPGAPGGGPRGASEISHGGGFQTMPGQWLTVPGTPTAR